MGNNESINGNVNECMEELEEKLWELLNITQMFKDVVKEGQEDIYILRSVSMIERVLKTVCEEDIVKLKELLA